MRVLQRVMFWAVAPGRDAQAPTLSQVLSRCSDPGVDKRVAYRHRNGIEAALLRRFVRMIEIELVDEFIQRHRKIGDIRPADACNLGKVLRAGHIGFNLTLPLPPGIPNFFQIFLLRPSGRCVRVLPNISNQRSDLGSTPDT